jgi:glycosyltransferase involved in cell wall biosynthesis
MPDSPLQITFVLPQLRSRPIGGFRVIYEYASHLSSRGHRVSLVHPTRLPHASRVRQLVRRSEWKQRLERSRGSAAVPWFEFPRATDIRVVESLTPDALPDADAVFATSWRTAQCVNAAAPSKGSKLYFIQHHETWDGPRDAVDATWRLPMHKVVISKWLAEIAATMGESECTTYIPNGIDFEQFTLLTPNARREPYRVGMLTNSKEWKGTPDGIAALVQAREAIPNLRVTLFGTGGRPAQAPPWMEYRENVTGEALRDLYNELAVFLHPSWAEGWPLPPAEAMACGCALVATDNPGVLDYIAHEQTAIVAPRRDPGALASALTRVLGDRALRESIAAAGHDSIQRYTWQRATDGLESLLQRVLAEPDVTDIRQCA